jgi:RecA/RadA recombinase
VPQVRLSRREYQEHLEMALSNKERKELEKEQNKKFIKTEHGLRYEKSKTLQEHFNKSKAKAQRNDAIMIAMEDGYRQSAIATHLKLSSSVISKIVIEKRKSGNS